MTELDLVIRPFHIFSMDDYKQFRSFIVKACDIFYCLNKLTTRSKINNLRFKIYKEKYIPNF